MNDKFYYSLATNSGSDEGSSGSGSGGHGGHPHHHTTSHHRKTITPENALNRHHPNIHYKDLLHGHYEQHPRPLGHSRPNQDVITVHPSDNVIDGGHHHKGLPQQDFLNFIDRHNRSLPDDGTIIGGTKQEVSNHPHPIIRKAKVEANPDYFRNHTFDDHKKVAPQHADHLGHSHTGPAHNFGDHPGVGVTTATIPIQPEHPELSQRERERRHRTQEAIEHHREHPETRAQRKYDRRFMPDLQTSSVTTGTLTGNMNDINNAEHFPAGTGMEHLDTAKTVDKPTLVNPSMADLIKMKDTANEDEVHKMQHDFLEGGDETLRLPTTKDPHQSNIMAGVEGLHPDHTDPHADTIRNIPHEQFDPTHDRIPDATDLFAEAGMLGATIDHNASRIRPTIHQHKPSGNLMFHPSELQTSLPIDSGPLSDHIGDVTHPFGSDIHQALTHPGQVFDLDHDSSVSPVIVHPGPSGDHGLDANHIIRRTLSDPDTKGIFSGYPQGNQPRFGDSGKLLGHTFERHPLEGQDIGTPAPASNPVLDFFGNVAKGASDAAKGASNYLQGRAQSFEEPFGFGEGSPASVGMAVAHDEGDDYNIDAFDGAFDKDSYNTTMSYGNNKSNTNLNKNPYINYMNDIIGQLKHNSYIFTDIGLVGLGALLVLPKVGLKAIPPNLSKLAWTVSLSSLAIGLLGHLADPHGRAFAGREGGGGGGGHGGGGGAGGHPGGGGHEGGGHWWRTWRTWRTWWIRT